MLLSLMASADAGWISCASLAIGGVVVLGTGNVYGITMIYGGCAALFIPIIP
jgi:hypothetical protein